MRYFSCRFILPGCLLLLAHAASAQALEWTHYHNARFGVQADIPQGWKAGEEPANGDGLNFTSPDGKATLLVWGRFHVLDTIKEEMDIDDAPSEGETITYHKRGARSLTVSGTHGDRIFFSKYILTCHDHIWNAFTLEYPAAQQSSYAPIVEHISASMHNSSGGQSACQ